MIRRGRLLFAIGSSRGEGCFLSDECGAGVPCGGGGRREEASAEMWEQRAGGGGWNLDARCYTHGRGFAKVESYSMLVVPEFYLGPVIGSLTARISARATVSSRYS
jgi:hypothetical protein